MISFAGWAYSRRYHARTERLQESWGRTSTLTEETVVGIRVVKGLGAGRPLAAQFRERSAAIVERALDIARLDASFLPVLEFLPMLGLLAVLWLGGRRVIAGDLSLGSFVAFNAYVAMLVWPLRVLGQRVTTLQKAVGASVRISEVLDAEPQVREPRHPARLTGPIRGDVLYGARLPFGPPAELPRQRVIALHGRSLTFLHPIRYEPLTVTAPLPACWPPWA